MTYKAAHVWHEAKSHSGQRFHSNRGAEDRRSSRQILRTIAPRRKSAAGHPDRDCADVASRNLPLRNACRVKAGTIQGRHNRALLAAWVSRGSVVVRVRHDWSFAVAALLWGFGESGVECSGVECESLSLR